MKDLYIEIVEELCGELEEAGYSPQAAYEKASDLAWDIMKDRLADMVDGAYSQYKDRELDRLSEEI